MSGRLVVWALWARLCGLSVGTLCGLCGQTLWTLPVRTFFTAFKAAHRAARTANSAHSPSLCLRSRWRSRYGGANAGRLAREQKPWAAMTYSNHRVSRGETDVILPLSLLSGSGRTRQERLRRRLRRSSTHDRTCPRVPESAAIGSRDKSGQDGLAG
jgi:hypothetical protein